MTPETTSKQERITTWQGSPVVTLPPRQRITSNQIADSLGDFINNTRINHLVLNLEDVGAFEENALYSLQTQHSDFKLVAKDLRFAFGENDYIRDEVRRIGLLGKTDVINTVDLDNNRLNVRHWKYKILRLSTDDFRYTTVMPTKDALYTASGAGLEEAMEIAFELAPERFTNSIILVDRKKSSKIEQSLNIELSHMKVRCNRTGGEFIVYKQHPEKDPLDRQNRWEDSGYKVASSLEELRVLQQDIEDHRGKDSVILNGHVVKTREEKIVGRNCKVTTITPLNRHNLHVWHKNNINKIREVLESPLTFRSAPPKRGDLVPIIVYRPLHQNKRASAPLRDLFRNIGYLVNVRNGLFVVESPSPQFTNSFRYDRHKVKGFEVTDTPKETEIEIKIHTSLAYR